MVSNHFNITKDWLQEVMCLFKDEFSDTSDNPFKDEFFRCSATCSHCGYTVGYILVAYFERATVIIWDKDCDTDILLLEKSNWELVDIDALSPEGSTVNTIPCLPIPSPHSLPIHQWVNIKNTYETIENALSHLFSDAIYKKGVNVVSDFTLTEEIQTYVKLLQNTNLGTPSIRSMPDTLLIKVGNVFSTGSGILFILNK